MEEPEKELIKFPTKIIIDESLDSENLSKDSLLSSSEISEEKVNQDLDPANVVNDDKPISNERISFEVNLQPEKIIEVYKFEDGSLSYRVRWKDTWIHEQLITAYQYLVDEYWSQQHPPKDILKDSNKKEDNIHEIPQIDFNADQEKEDVNITETASDIQTKTLEAIFEKQQNIKKEAEQKDVSDSLDPINKLDTKDKTEGQPVEEKPSSYVRLKRKRKAAAAYKKLNKKSRGRPRKKNEQENNIKASEDDGKENKEGETIDHANDDGVTKTKRKNAERYEYSEDKGPCTCNICGKVISNKYGLREHQAVVHFKNGKFQCEICGKRVTNKRALNLHMTSHSNERSFVCEQCGSSHKTKGNLNYHVKTMHEMIKNFRCDICFKTFKVQADLKEHCFTMHANTGIITCIVCKKKLTTALSIYTHSVMHSGAREYECDICGYAFKTFTGLKEHKITHLETKPIRNCPYCERKFFSRSQYNAHVMRHTADGSLITFKCPICDVKFQHKSSYNRHVIRHQPGGDLEFPKENPYLLVDESELPEGVCHKCRKYYASKSGFYLHLKKCRDGIIQQFQCPFCERGCSNRSSLKRHIQRRHKGVPYEGQPVQTHEVIQEGNEGQQQSNVMSSQDGIQFQTSYFDHGYGNQISTVDASQLSSVDVQLLIDSATATQGDNQANHILGNVGQVGQISQNTGDDTQNLHILTESEAAQFAAQLSQHGVIVRNSDGSLTGPHDQDQQIIVSSAHIDARTGQLLVSESQAAEIIANAQALRENQLNSNGTSSLTLQSNESDMLAQNNVLQFGNRPAVIQIHPTPGTLTNQQVLTLQGQSISDNTVDMSSNSHMQSSNIVNITDERVNVSNDHDNNNIHQLNNETVSVTHDVTTESVSINHDLTNEQIHVSHNLDSLANGVIQHEEITAAEIQIQSDSSHHISGGLQSDDLGGQQIVLGDLHQESSDVSNVMGESNDSIELSNEFHHTSNSNESFITEQVELNSNLDNVEHQYHHMSSM